MSSTRTINRTNRLYRRRATHNFISNRYEIDTTALEKEYNKVKLPTIVENEIKEEDDNVKRCCICLERVDIDNDRKIVMQGCVHEYHYKCFNKWYKYQKNKKRWQDLRKIKCELCQTSKKYKVVNNLVVIKKSNRFSQMCIIS
jgi:hypothetical protein